MKKSVRVTVESVEDGFMIMVCACRSPAEKLAAVTDPGGALDLAKLLKEMTSAHDEHRVIVAKTWGEVVAKLGALGDVAESFEAPASTRAAS